MLEAAAALASLGYQIDFGWDNQEEINSLLSALSVRLPRFGLQPAIKSLYHHGSPLAMWRATRVYDLVFYLSDGSIPLLGGRNNILHFQIPHQHVGGRKLANQLKLKNIHHVVVNSQFTKRLIDEEYRVNSAVIYPPVTAIKPGKKTKTILSVGRFDSSINIKKQDVLIQAFRQLSPQLPGWKLVLVGGSSNREWEQRLQQLAKGLPVDFRFNAKHDELVGQYAQASIYWHAAGYQVDPGAHPELCEHFGITTVEALSAGCLPLVVGKGGQTEIIAEADYYWDSLDELVTKTLRFAKSPTLPRVELSSFSAKRFAQAIQALSN